MTELVPIPFVSDAHRALQGSPKELRGNVQVGKRAAIAMPRRPATQVVVVVAPAKLNQPKGSGVLIDHVPVISCLSCWRQDLGW